MFLRVQNQRELWPASTNVIALGSQILLSSLVAWLLSPALADLGTRFTSLFSCFKRCLKLCTISAVSSCFNPPVFAAMGGKEYVGVAYGPLDNFRAGSKHRDQCGRSCGDVHNCSFVSFSIFGGGESGSGGSHSQKVRRSNPRIKNVTTFAK